MRMNLRRCIGVLAVAAGIAIGGAAVQAVAAPFQDKDYSKTKTYQQGMREGKDDHARKLDHSKKRHFKKDDDQKLVDSGPPSMAVSIAGISTACSKDALVSSAKAVREALSTD